MCNLVFRKQSFKSYVTDLFFFLMEIDNILVSAYFFTVKYKPPQNKPHLKHYALLIHECIMLMIFFHLELSCMRRKWEMTYYFLTQIKCDWPAYTFSVLSTI